MQYFLIILPKLITFCILILLGVFMVKINIITENNLSLLSGLIVKIILPCLILSLVWENQTTFLSLLDFRRIALWQSSTYFMLIALTFFIIKLCHLKEPTSNTLYGCMIGGNYGFIVIPLMIELFAVNGGKKYIPICAAIDTFFVWTIGMYLFTNIKGSCEKKETPLKKIFNPTVCTFIVGLTLCTFHIPLPEPVVSVFVQLGNISCLGLIYLGACLCFIDFKKFHNFQPLLLIVLLRQILLPLVIHLISKPFLPDVERICIVLITAAPSLSAASMIAKQYHLDSDFAASAVFLTTLASSFSIPLVFYLMTIL